MEQVAHIAKEHGVKRERFASGSSSGVEHGAEGARIVGSNPI